MGEKEMTLESEKIWAIPMVHWCQWRPFLSPLTPVESICEYWTTLVQATCKSCYGTIQIIRKLKNWHRKHGVTTHWYWCVYWTCVPCTCSSQSRCWCKWTSRRLQEVYLHLHILMSYLRLQQLVASYVNYVHVTSGLCRWIATSESTLFIRTCNLSRKPFFVVAQSTTSKQPLPMKKPWRK